MIKYAASNLKNARKNRKQRNATRQEGLLWHLYLKNTKVRFYRQYRVGAFILDFYCPRKKLAVELDGGQHYEDDVIAYDDSRTAFLNESGITVLRFTNDDVDKSLQNVIATIEGELSNGE